MKARITFFFFVVCILAFFHVSAQTNNDLLITWHANNFVPVDFSGKAIPTNGNIVDVSVELLVNKKIQNISGATVSWFVDGTFFNKGVGMKEFSFPVTKVGRSSHSVRAVVQTKTTKYEGLVSIPVFNPITVIENKNPTGIVSSGDQVNLRILPYFFNIVSQSDILVSWKINNETRSDVRDSALTLNIGSPKTDAQRTMTIEAFVQNINNKIESAKEKITLLIH